MIQKFQAQLDKIESMPSQSNTIEHLLEKRETQPKKFHKPLWPKEEEKFGSGFERSVALRSLVKVRFNGNEGPGDGEGERERGRSGLLS